MKKKENQLWTLHLTIIVIVALMAMVSVTAMVMKDKVGGKAEAPGWNREFGAFCTTDAQCASGVCGGSITLPNGKAVPGIKVCV